MNRLTVFAIVVVLATLLVVRCSTPAATLRFRMKVEVNTPGGIRRGSSVMELVAERRFLIPMPGAGGSDWGGGFTLFGEAPFIETGGRAVFTLFHERDYRHNLSDAVLRTLPERGLPDKDASENQAGLFRRLARSSPTLVVEPQWYPAFATFPDPQKPATRDEIDAGKMGAGSFGGLAISRITIQPVSSREPLSTALSERFPALARERGLLALYKSY